jgi:hypothetical protein
MAEPAPHPVQRVTEDPGVVLALLGRQLTQRGDVPALQLFQRHHREGVPQQMSMAARVYIRGRAAQVGLKALRARWPGDKLYVICDNFCPHRHPKVHTWCADHDVELVFLPTYGSWLNWIEAEFAALRYFALNGTDHRTHAKQNASIESYIRWHNARAQPKTGFATDSPIRTWTHYPTKVA